LDWWVQKCGTLIGPSVLLSLFSPQLTLTSLPFMSGVINTMYWYGCEMNLLLIIGQYIQQQQLTTMLLIKILSHYLFFNIINDFPV
jgi:hypothetical protein